MSCVFTTSGKIVSFWHEKRLCVHREKGLLIQSAVKAVYLQQEKGFFFYVDSKSCVYPAGGTGLMSCLP